MSGLEPVVLGAIISGGAGIASTMLSSRGGVDSPAIPQLNHDKANDAARKQRKRAQGRAANILAGELSDEESAFKELKG